MSKKTVAQIIESGNDYVIQVKANQKTLFRAIQDVIVKQKPLDHYELKEKGHGRHSHWSVRVFNAITHDKAKEWIGLRRFIHVHKQTKKKSRIRDNDRLYIASEFQCCAEYFHKGIRDHWTIENSLHWVKDVIHKEDNNGIQTDNGPVNAAIFSSIAINIHRTKGTRSITEGQVIANFEFNKIFEDIRT